MGKHEYGSDVKYEWHIIAAPMLYLFTRIIVSISFCESVFTVQQRVDLQ